MIEIKIGKQGEGISFSGIEAQLADCAVCILHTYIAHDDFQNDFLRHPNEQNELLEHMLKHTLTVRIMNRGILGITSLTTINYLCHSHVRYL